MSTKPETNDQPAIAAGPSAAACSVPVDFQTAPYDALCGCVSILISRQFESMLATYSDEGQRRLKRRLFSGSEGNRNVCANCPDCHGTGITPNAIISCRWRVAASGQEHELVVIPNPLSKEAEIRQWIWHTRFRKTNRFLEE